MTAEVHQIDAAAGTAARDAQFAAFNLRLHDVVESVQSELVAQWLKETDADKRERCWNEVRALEVVYGRLCASLSAELGLFDDESIGDVDVDVRTVDAVEQLSAPLWVEPFDRWRGAVRRWLGK